MLKKILSVFLCFTMIGCSTDTNKEANSSSSVSEEKEVENTSSSEADNSSTAESSEKPTRESEYYTVGETISTDTIEMTFSESGVSENIRVTSTESGIQMTNGPSVLEGQKYVYLKGEVKSLAKKPIRVALGGTVSIDGYSYPLKFETMQTTASPKSSIDPFETLIILVYTAVPNELADSFEKAIIIFGFNDNFEAGSIMEAQHLYSTEVTRE